MILRVDFLHDRKKCEMFPVNKNTPIKGCNSERELLYSFKVFISSFFSLESLFSFHLVAKNRDMQILVSNKPTRTESGDESKRETGKKIQHGRRASSTITDVVVSSLMCRHGGGQRSSDLQKWLELREETG